MRNLIPYKSGTILLLVCAVLFVFNGAIFAQVTGKIAGKVLDSGTNEPLPGVNVQIQGTTMGGATDLEGDYYIINIPPGTYNLEASYVGYQSIVKTGVIVSSNNTTPIQFSLTATRWTNLQQQSVLRLKKLLPFRLSKISQITSDYRQEYKVTLSVVVVWIRPLLPSMG